MGWFDLNRPTASAAVPTTTTRTAVPGVQDGSAPVPGAEEFWSGIGDTLSGPLAPTPTAAAPTGSNGASLPPVAGGMAPLVETGGGQYPLSSVSGDGLMRPWTTPFSFDQTDLEKDPGYQFTLAEGMKALERGSAANGTLFSPQFRNAAMRYTTGLANQHFGDAYNRARGEYTMAHDIYKGNQTDQFNRLSSLAGTGQQAANFLGDAGRSYAGSGADLITGAGNANAAGVVGAANAWSGGLRDIGNSALAYEMLRRPNPYILA